MRTSALATLLLVVSTATATAGPTMMPELVCGDTLGIVTAVADGDHGARLQLDHPPTAGRLGICGSGDRWANPEGCYLEPARITAPAGAKLTVGARYLARVRPAGGASCSSTAEATALIPLGLWQALLGVFSSGS